MFALHTIPRQFCRASPLAYTSCVKRTLVMLGEQEKRAINKMAKIIWFESQKRTHVNPRFNKNIETICELASLIKEQHPHIPNQDLYLLAKDAFMNTDRQLSAIREKARKGHYRELLKILMDDDF